MKLLPVFQFVGRRIGEQIERVDLERRVTLVLGGHAVDKRQRRVDRVSRLPWIAHDEGEHKFDAGRGGQLDAAGNLDPVTAFPHPLQLPVVSAFDAAHAESATGRIDIFDIALVDAIHTEKPTPDNVDLVLSNRPRQIRDAGLREKNVIVDQVEERLPARLRQLQLAHD